MNLGQVWDGEILGVEQFERKYSEGQKLEVSVRAVTLRRGRKTALRSISCMHTPPTHRNKLYCPQQKLCLLHPPSCRTRGKGPWSPNINVQNKKGLRPARSKTHHEGSRGPPRSWIARPVTNAP